MELKLPKYFTQKKISGMPEDHLFSTPNKVWRLLLLFFTLAIVGVFIFDGIIFYKISNDAFLEVNTSKIILPELINRNKLDRVLNSYKEKKDQFNYYLLKPPIVIDPSR